MGILTSRVRSPESLRLLWFWSIVGFLGFSFPFIRFYLPSHGIIDVNGNIVGDDFVNVWFGARLAMRNEMHALYFPSEYVQHMAGAFSQHFYDHNFSYFPNVLPLILVFGLLPYLPSLAFWTFFGTASLIAALKRNKFSQLSLASLFLIAFSPANILNAIGGQNGAFTGALFLGGLFLCRASPLTAGVLFGILTVKPHLGILIPFVLLLQRNWRCIASASVTALLLITTSVLIWGIAPWQYYMAGTMPFQTEFLSVHRPDAKNMLMPGPYEDLSTLMHVPEWYAVIICVCIGMAALWMSFHLLIKEGLTPRVILMLATTTLIILPYGFEYDMGAITGALVIYLASAAEIPMLTHLMLGLLWALPALILEIKTVQLPISSSILILSLVSLYFCESKMSAASSIENLLGREGERAVTDRTAP